MSSNKTSNLKLHSWVRTDPFSMDEFNENFTAIDKAVEANTTALAGKVDNAALNSVKSELNSALAKKADSTTVTSLAQYAAKIYRGSYVGKGTAGSSNRSSITFPFLPKLVIIDVGGQGSLGSASAAQVFFFWGTAAGYYYGAAAGSVSYDDAAKKMTWYCITGGSSSDAAPYQFNTLNRTYHYIALG